MTTRKGQRRYLPSYAVLRSFECAARHQSFTLAAEELHLTQSAVSRQVKEFEHSIGVNLFRRVGRRVILTKAGQNLAAELVIDLENIRQTVLRAITASDSGSCLRIAVLPTFANRWLIPRLPEFTQLHPKIIVNLSTRLQSFDLAKERFDLALHFGTDDWPDTKMIHLFSENMIAVCSPDFRDTHQINHPEKLAEVSLLHLETRPTAWFDWFVEFDQTKNNTIPGRQFDQFSMLITGAVASLGAALLPKYLIEDELEKGRLVQIGTAELKTKRGYFIVSPSGKNSPHVETFVRWIQVLAHKDTAHCPP